MGCSAQKQRKQHIKEPDQRIVQNQQKQNQESRMIETEQKIEQKSSEFHQSQSPCIQRRLKHMVSSDEVQKYLNKKQSLTTSPFKFAKNSPDQRRKLSLANGPQL